MINRIVGNQNICKLLTYSEKDAKQRPELGFADRIKLYQNTNTQTRRIFPYQFIPVKDDQAMTCIAMTTLQDVSRENPEVFHTSMVLLISCHQDLWQVDGGLRPNLIKAQLMDMLHNRHLQIDGDNYGYRMKLEYSHPYTFNDRYHGFELVFAVSDVQNQC